MPNINLRLTDEEHDALKAWAHEAHRSLQREIIFRLFANGQLPEREQGGGQTLERAATQRASATQDLELGGRVVPERSTAPRSGSCPMQTAAGAKCKACGKVHPL